MHGKPPNYIYVLYLLQKIYMKEIEGKNPFLGIATKNIMLRLCIYMNAGPIDPN